MIKLQFDSNNIDMAQDVADYISSFGYDVRVDESNGCIEVSGNNSSGDALVFYGSSSGSECFDELDVNTLDDETRDGWLIKFKDKDVYLREPEKNRCIIVGQTFQQNNNHVDDSNPGDSNLEETNNNINIGVARAACEDVFDSGKKLSDAILGLNNLALDLSLSLQQSDRKTLSGFYACLDKYYTDVKSSKDLGPLRSILDALEKINDEAVNKYKKSVATTRLGKQDWWLRVCYAVSAFKDYISSIIRWLIVSVACLLGKREKADLSCSKSDTINNQILDVVNRFKGELKKQMDNTNNESDNSNSNVNVKKTT